MRDEEVQEIKNVFPVIKEMLPEEHRQTIEQHGLIDGFAGNFATQCIDGKACVFVYYDSGIAKCAIERAFFDGKVSFRKPISCHLFPIRISKEVPEIHYEYFSECEPALEKGGRENIPVHEFAKEALIRAFGAEWNEKLKHEIDKELLL